MILHPSQFSGFEKEIGPKTKNLKILTESGYNVPTFFALPSSVIILLQKQGMQGIEYQTLIKEIKAASQANRFAVRSSALIEDTETGSQAGQFLTKIDQSLEQVPEAIYEIINHASNKLHGNLNQFSIIIQEYVKADISGVCFTRNPTGGREMVIEYHEGIGEDVVSGKIRPKKMNIFWNQPTPQNILTPTIEIFKRIEKQFGSAQDIEWLIKNGALWLLQTRPITTISKIDSEASHYLDSILPIAPFLYEKTEIAEIAPRPSPMTLGLLHKIYARGGPVHAVYKKYGITYEPLDFLKIIGNELYVDREVELKTLLPAFTMLRSGRPSLHTIYGLWTSLKNILRLQKISLKNYNQLFEKVKASLSKEIAEDASSIDSFLETYQLIFEINLLAARALQKLKLAAKNIKINPALLFTLPETEIKNKLPFPEGEFIGNTIEISDITPFKIPATKPLSTNEGPDIFKNLPAFKQAYLKPIIADAQAYSQLREYGRWLTVKHVSAIRRFALQEATNLGFKTPSIIYFAMIEELGAILENVLKQRKTDYLTFEKFQFSPILTNVPKKSDKKSLEAVSPGNATGILKIPADINPQDRGIILYTKILSPELVQYFPSIAGILSEQGGLLSHLAIMAREHHIPVLVGANSDTAKLGQTVTVDADNERVTIN
jgi:phosphoenolpyruvate synthase/pyruvate phosphate dikinase